MAQVKKFGAFAGVFTPSILTILGVIMYMRLGWVVGEAGLVTALVIIVIAHIISVTTGLSISSIATDKKIKAGGIYYILSRSLGLPMGGAIGIALFVGTALSISLYLVGFAESFLSIEPIRNFLGLSQDVNGYRIIGTGSIVILVAIAFTSTSLALKTQYYILAAIALSLVSIFLGFFTNTGYAPESTLFSSAVDGIPVEMIFAVFFPAVTGFTAGVAMSGDLKNPKKSIPSGTLAAVAVGFVVYVGLAIGLAYFVNRDLLINDTNFLLKIAWYSPLVIAGIWGATLSSALGGILGGPRILQAISTDRITPKIFAKGYGTGNEPRNALILIFLIAEAGILIGELNVIAGIVSMFYLASYGFINLAYYLESWASTDFRPSFKINRYIALIGFIASFGVMFKLDMASMFIALILMWGLYFLLQRKQMKLDYGDVWQSVWSTVVRTALKKMDGSNIELRNWKPNIILFSGGTKKRPHLVELGHSLVGKFGLLSNFDLIENKEATTLFPKHKQSLPEGFSNKAVFFRRQTVKDIYDGVETIARTYGFSGVEPNTIIMGWGRQTQDPVRFTKMINVLNKLDYNILLLDYDKNSGFGDYKLIDIWWEGTGNQGHLALTLTKFLLFSEKWQDTNLRLLIVNSINHQRDIIQDKAEKIVDELRINAQIKIINNEVEQKDFYDIVLSESDAADLIFIGIPEFKESEATSFIQKTNMLFKNAGTTALLKASSHFKELSVTPESEKLKHIRKGVHLIIPDEIEKPEIQYPIKVELAELLIGFHNKQTEIINDFYKNNILAVFQQYDDIVFSFEKIIDQNFANISKNQKILLGDKRKKLFSQIMINFLVRSDRLIREKNVTVTKQQEAELRKGVSAFTDALRSHFSTLPSKVTIRLFSGDLIPEKDDPWPVSRFKFVNRILSSNKKLKKGIPYNVKANKLIINEYEINFFKSLFEFEKTLGGFSLQFVHELQNLITSIITQLETISNKLNQKGVPSNFIHTEKENAKVLVGQLKELINVTHKAIYKELIFQSSESIEAICEKFDKPAANKYIRTVKQNQIRELSSEINEVPAKWLTNQQFLYNDIDIEIQILLLKIRLQNIFSESNKEIWVLIHEKLIAEISDKEESLHKFLSEIETLSEEEVFHSDSVLYQEIEIRDMLNKILERTLRKIWLIVNKLPSRLTLLGKETKDDFRILQFAGLDTVDLSVSRHLDLYIQKNLTEPLQKSIDSLPEKITTIVSSINDNIRLLQVTSNLQDDLFINQEVQGIADDYSGFLKKQLNKIYDQRQNIEKLVGQIETDLKENLKSMDDALTLPYLLKTKDSLHQYVYKKEVQKRISFLQKSTGRLESFYQRIQEQFWYKQSKALLMARKITSEKKPASAVNDLLRLRENNSPDSKILKQLPFYYKQLFLKSQNYQEEFWHGRKAELADALKAIQWHIEGRSGGILITGNRSSGKTFLSQYIVSKLLPGHSAYIIYPPSGGSVDPKELLRSIQNATGYKGSYKSIFSKLPGNTVFIINDLELWWEKSEDGNELISIILDLIKTYSRNCLFIVNVNQQSFGIINEINKIDTYFLNILECAAFDAESLKEIILFRHRSGGFGLHYGKKRNELSPSKLAGIITKYFNYSKGNIGVALQQWIANIAEFKNDTIFIKSPQMPDDSILNNLDGETYIYLSQFILHRQLSIPKLERITQDNAEVIQDKLSFLLRSGLIDELSDNIFEINRYVNLHVLIKLESKELI